MTYKDGKTEPKVGDKVLGDKLKGTVTRLLKDKVLVKTKGVWNPKNGKIPDLQTEVDPAALILLQREADAPVGSRPKLVAR